MNYITIVKDDLINGTGVRVSLYVSGCSHGCTGCFNQKTWDYRNGNPFTTNEIDIILKELEKDYIEGLTLLGGDPLMPKNISTVIDLCKIVKNKFPNKNIWCWTGYTLEEVLNNHSKDILNYIDVLVDGRFIEEQKNLKLKFRGSSNQRILKKNIDF